MAKAVGKAVGGVALRDRRPKRRFLWLIRYAATAPIAIRRARPFPSATRPRCSIRRHAGQCPSGRTSLGEPERKESSKPSLPLSVCGTADGPLQRIRDKGQQHLSGERGLAHRRISRVRREEKLPRQLARGDEPAHVGCHIKARWVCEQAHQQLKEELGLDHFEGRSWQGLHRHAPLTMIACAFLQYRRLTQVRREKRVNGPPPQPTWPAVRHAIVQLIVRLPRLRCPHCRRWNSAGKRE